MTDLEMTKLCAAAMGYTEFRYHGDCKPEYVCATVKERPDKWWPLRDDAQAMALVRKLRLTVVWTDRHLDGWLVRGWYQGKTGVLCEEVDAANLNRAIVECVAKMQAAKVMEEE